MRSYTVRDWVTIGLFGALWGVVEMTLGGYLHVIFPPQANTFLTGLVMGGIGVTVALTGRHFVQRRGAVFLIAVVTAFVKLLSPGGSRLGPFVAILIEGLLMEGVLWVSGRPAGGAFVAGGALAVGWNLPHKFLMMRLVYGESVAAVYTKLVEEGRRMLGSHVSAAVAIVLVLLAVRLIVGGIAGWGAWGLGRAVARRLGRHSVAAEDGRR
jgi:hypothetical protein